MKSVQTRRIRVTRGLIVCYEPLMTLIGRVYTDS